MYLCWVRELRMQADLEKSLMDYLDEFLDEPSTTDRDLWGAPTRPKVDRASWGKTADAIASQRAMTGGQD